MDRLQGKIALVTGAARRIGREIALALAEAGVHVAFSYCDSEREARETVGQIQRLGVSVWCGRADLTDLDQCDQLLAEADRALGPVDILVNNASAFVSTPLSRMAQERAGFQDLFDRLTRLHVRAPLYLGLQLGRKMKKRGWGRIVNLTDRAVAKSQAYPNHALYLASKYGLQGVTQCLALELAPEVAVNSVAPGLALAPEEYSREKVQRLTSRVPLRRQAGAREIADDVLFLLRSEFKTGCTLLTDGGESLILLDGPGPE